MPVIAALAVRLSPAFGWTVALAAGFTTLRGLHRGSVCTARNSVSFPRDFNPEYEQCASLLLPIVVFAALVK